MSRKKEAPKKHVLSLRVTDAERELVAVALQQMNLTPTAFMELGVSLALAQTAHSQFAAPPTESQRLGMRQRCLAILRRGGEYLPSELAVLMGTAPENAASYARDLRKAKYGGHVVLSRPVVIDGKHVSYYRIKEEV